MAEFDANAYFRQAAPAAPNQLSPDELAIEPYAQPQLRPDQAEAIRNAPTAGDKARLLREAGVPEAEIARTMGGEAPVPHVATPVAVPDWTQPAPQATELPVDKAESLLRAEAKKAQTADAYRRKTDVFQDWARRQNATWTGQLDLTTDSSAGAAVNLGARITSGLTRLLGGTGSIVLNSAALADLETVPQAAQNAYVRYAQGEASKEDLALLNQRDNQEADGTTYLKRMELAVSSLKGAQDLTEATDTQAIVQDDVGRAFSSELRAEAADGMEALELAGEQFDNAEIGSAAKNLVLGVADLAVSGGGAILGNKQAVLEYTAESLVPELLLIGTGMSAAALVGNIGNGLENYNEGLRNYAADHDGALPTPEERRWMAATAVASGVLETLSAGAVYRQIRPGAKAVEAGARGSLKRTAKAGATAAGVEGPSEGLQSYLEGEASYRPASGLDIYEGTVIGTAAGGTAAGGGRGAAELAGATEEQQQLREQTAAERAAEEERFQQAIKTGDVSAYTDKAQGAAYDPAKAVQALAAWGQSQELDPEARQAHQKALFDLVQRAAQDQKDAAEVLEGHSQQALEDNKARLAKQEALLAQAEDAAQRAEHEANIRLLQERIAATEALTRTDMATLQERATQLRERFQQAQQVYAQAATGQVAPAQVQDLKTQAGLTGEAANTTAPTQLATLAMSSPEILSGAEASTLAEQEGLSEQQRTYLRSFAETEQQQEAVRSLGRTRTAIVEGAEGYRGIQDYRRLVSGALAAGDPEAAQEYSADLQNFAQDHSAKARVLSQALQQFRRTGQPVQVVRGLAPGSWQISPERLSRKALRDNRGLTINDKSFALVRAVREEAKALQAAQAEIQAQLQASNQGKESVDNAQRPQPESAPAVDTVRERPAADRVEQPVPREPDTQTADPAPEPAAGRVVDAPTEEGPEDPGVTPVEAVEGAPAAELAPGGLPALQESVDGPVTNANYREANLLAAWFTQSAGKDSDATHKPLVAVQGFLTQVSQDPALVERYVAEDGQTEGERTVARRQALATFTAQARQWQEVLQGLVKPLKPTLRYTNLASFMQDDAGQLPENVTTALSYAAFSYVTEQASGPWLSSDEQIRELLGEPDHYEVTAADRALLGPAGTRANVVINSLGQRAAQALGLKAKADAPVSAQPRLEVALGAHILALLQEQGLVERINITDSRLKGDGPTTFVRLARDWDAPGKPVTLAAQTLVESVWGSQGYLDKLFGAEPALREPALTPPGFTEQTTRGTSSRVPRNMQQIQELHNNRPWRVRTWLNWLWRDLDEDLQEAIVGVEDPSRAHHSQRTGIEGKNDSLRREIAHFTRFEEQLLQGDYDTEFYFPSSVWVNQRAGVVTTTVNPQASKVHRHLVGMSAWRGQVSLDPATAEHTLFLQNVAMGLGIPADKQTQKTSLAALDDKVKQEPFREAINIIKQQQQYKEPDRAAQETIVAAVKAAGEGMQSLDALHAYARMELAREAGQDQFDADMFMMEVDGVTNGPMLSLLQLGAAKDAPTLFKLINKGGMFETGAAYQNFVQYKSRAGANDLYETATSTALNLLLKEIQPGSPQERVLQAIEYFKGGKLFENNRATGKGRKIIKTPLTGMMFGQAVKAGVGAMFNELVEDIYSGVTRIARQEGTPQGRADALKVWARQVNALIGNPNLHIPADLTLEAALDLTFTEAQLGTMRQRFSGTRKEGKGTLGYAVERTMNRLFASFLARRTELNRAAQVASQLYTAAFEHLKIQKVQERMADGTLPWRKHPKTGAKVPLQDLSARDIRAIEQQLQGLRPTTHSALSKLDRDLGAGIFLPKEGRGLDGKNTAYRQEVGFSRSIPSNVAGTKPTKSMTATAYQKTLDDPGVRSLILSIHSADSAISAQAYGQVPALNIHDANGLAISDVVAGARNLNRATYRTMLGYSVPLELRNVLERTLKGLHGMQEAIATDPGLQEALTAAVKGIRLSKDDLAAMEAAQLDPLSYVMQQVNAAAYQAELTKLEAMGQVAYMDQYAQEGGQFRVTDKLRALAQQRREQVAQQAEQASQRSVALAQDLMAALAAPAPVVAEEAETGPSLDVPLAALRSLIASLQRTAQVPERLQGAMAQLDQALAAGTAVDTALAQLGPVTAAELVEVLNTYHQDGRETAWGTLGAPVTPADPDLAAFLATTPNPTTGQVMDYLDQHFRRSGNRAEALFHHKLLQVLRKTVAEVPVRYITRDTPEVALPTGSVSRAKGWYETTPGNQHIGIKSPDFVHSAVQPEVLLHELTHRALAGVVDNPTTPEARELVSDLETLLGQTRQWIQAQDSPALARQFAEATSNLHEFIAWGMTNQVFQTQVLEQVGVSALDRRGSNRLLNAMQAFVAKLTALLFGKRAGTTEQNGLHYLIRHTSGLFMAAAEAGKARADAATHAMADPGPFEEVKQYTSEQLFEALGQLQPTPLNPGHAEHLKEVLSDLVGQLHGPYGAYRVEANERASYSSEDVFLESLFGRMPFASEVLGQPIKIGAQEAFVLEQVEATVRAATADTTRTTSAAYRELRKLYQETRQRLQPKDLYEGDWAQATPEERRQAEALYAFIFRPQANADGTSNYLSRFAALGLAWEPLRRQLMVPTARSVPAARGMKLGEALKAWFQRLLEVLNGRLTRTHPGQRGDVKLQLLLDQLVGIEAKRRATVVRTRERERGLDGSLKALAEGARKKADRFGRAKFFRASRSGLVRGFGVLASAIAGDRVDELIRTLEDYRDAHHQGRQGVLADIITEIRGTNDTNLVAHQHLRVANHNEQTRKHVIDRTSQVVLESFDEGGEYLTDKDREAITRIGLRTDIAALLDHLDTEELMQVLQDDLARERLIKAYERRLAQTGPYRHYWRRGAMDLGYFMATNINRNDNLMLNAHNLARLAGTDQLGQLDEAQAQSVEDLLDPLISLYALRYSPAADRQRFRQVVAREAQRGKESGILMVLGLHQELKRKAREQLFDGQPAHFMKGYTKEIYNHRKALYVADGQDAINLERMGARKGPQLSQDPADPSREAKHLFTIDDGGARPWVTGTLSYTGSRARGSKAHGRLVTPDGLPSPQNQSTHAELMANKRAAIQALFQPQPGYNPTTPQAPRLVPVLNTQGQVVNHRYLMSAEVKDTLLERNNRMEDVLGAMAGNIVDKVDSKAQNAQVVQAMYDQFQAEWKDRPGAYIEVSENSPDPEIRNTYRMLPEETKRAVRAVWGRNALMVRKDLYTLHFGYRKASLVGVFEKDADERGTVEGAVAAVLETILGDKAMLRVRQAEDGWQALVAEVKDFWVIKNLFTLLGNVSSNVSELIWLGVPAKDIIRDHRVALEGVLAYQRDHNELTALKLRRDSGYGNQSVAEVEDRIVELEDALARNPVKRLVDAGLFQTIVEDIDTNVDRFSYKSRLARWVDEQAAEVPEGLKETAKTVYMAHDTPLYKLLYQGTHLSDFIARYTLVNHLTTRADNPLSEEEAMTRAVEAFVNYDIPTNKFIQYLNDMGLIMFTKYYLRIQKVLVQLYRDHPGRSLLMVSFAHFFNSVSTLLDAGFWNRLDNVTSAGALEYPEAIGEALPIQAATSLM